MAKLFNIFKKMRGRKKVSNQTDPMNELSELVMSSCSERNDSQNAGKSDQHISRSISGISITEPTSLSSPLKTNFTQKITLPTEEDIFYRYKDYNDDYRNELCLELNERLANLEKEYKMYRRSSTEREIRLKQSIEGFNSEKLNYEKQISCLFFDNSQLESHVLQLKQKINDLETNKEDIIKRYRGEKKRFKKLEKKYRIQIVEYIRNMERYQKKLFDTNNTLISLIHCNQPCNVSCDYSKNNDIVKNKIKVNAGELSFDENENKIETDNEQDYRTHLSPKHLRDNVRLKAKYLQLWQKKHLDESPKDKNYHCVRNVGYSNQDTQNHDSQENSSENDFQNEHPQNSLLSKRSLNSCKIENDELPVENDPYKAENQPYIAHHSNPALGKDMLFDDLNQKNLLSYPNDIDQNHSRHFNLNLNSRGKSSCFVQSGSRRNTYCIPEAPYNNNKPNNTVSLLDCLKSKR